MGIAQRQSSVLWAENTASASQRLLTIWIRFDLAISGSIEIFSTENNGLLLPRAGLIT